MGSNLILKDGHKVKLYQFRSKKFETVICMWHPEDGNNGNLTY